jgi:hypothetical protein
MLFGRLAPSNFSRHCEMNVPSEKEAVFDPNGWYSPDVNGSRGETGPPSAWRAESDLLASQHAWHQPVDLKHILAGYLRATLGLARRLAAWM